VFHSSLGTSRLDDIGQRRGSTALQTMPSVPPPISGHPSRLPSKHAGPQTSRPTRRRDPISWMSSRAGSQARSPVRQRSAQPPLGRWRRAPRISCSAEGEDLLTPLSSNCGRDCGAHPARTLRIACSRTAATPHEPAQAALSTRAQAANLPARFGNRGACESRLVLDTPGRASRMALGSNFHEEIATKTAKKGRSSDPREERSMPPSGEEEGGRKLANRRRTDVECLKTSSSSLPAPHGQVLRVGAAVSADELSRGSDLAGLYSLWLFSEPLCAGCSCVSSRGGSGPGAAAHARNPRHSSTEDGGTE